jgi:Phage integrase family
MKNLTLSILLACSLGLPIAASASVLTFEDLNPSPSSFDVMPSPYMGFTFTNWFYGPDTTYTPASGVIDLFTDYADPSNPGNLIITNNNAVSRLVDFVFEGAAFSGYSGITFELWNDSALVHTSATLPDAPGATPYAPTFLSSGYAGLVDKVVVSGVQGYFSMDDFTYQEAATTKGLRDRAILSVLLFHALRREEVTKLLVKDYNLNRQGVPYIRVQGKGGKTRYLPTHPATLGHIAEYLAKAGHGQNLDGALFRAVRNPTKGDKTATLTANGIYEHAVCAYMRKIGLTGDMHAPHALRATAATNALSHDADIAKVQEWLGHASIQTTRIYDRRSTKPEDSPTFRVRY